MVSPSPRTKKVGWTPPTPPIPEGKEDARDKETKSDEADSSSELLDALLAKLPPLALTTATESIGHRHTTHRRTQSNALFSILDTPSSLQYRPRSMSLAQMPSLEKYYPGSHLLENIENEDRSLYLSLWLLPPARMERRYSKEIAKLSLKHNKLGSSAPFVPHVTVVGSIRCETHREVEELGKKLSRKLRRMSPVPCRFYEPYNVISGSNEKRCCAMYNEQNQLVWSQSCIAFMEQSDEYMALLEKAREVLELPKGEWMFPAPAKEPHYSKFYGHKPIPDNQLPPLPEDFVTDQLALFYTTPGTVEGVARWREVIRIQLQDRVSEVSMESC